MNVFQQMKQLLNAGQSADLARAHADAMAEYVNDKLDKDPRTPQVYSRSKLD